MAYDYTTKVEDGLDFNIQENNLPPEKVSERADKINYALGDQSPGVPSITNAIISGNENSLREGVAQSEEGRIANEQLQIVKEMTQANGPVSPDLIAMTQALASNVKINPQSIVEKKYGERLLSDTYFHSPFESALVDLSLAAYPEKTNILFDIAKNEIAKSEIIKKTMDDLNLKWQNQPAINSGGQFSSKVSDVLEQFIPFASWYNISNDTQILGSNIREQVLQLHSLPVDQFESEFKRRVAEIAKVNTLDAITFAQAVYQYSSNDEFWGNAQSFLDITDIATPVAGALFKGVRGTVNSIKAFRTLNAADTLASAGRTADAAAARIAEIAQREQVLFRTIDNVAAKDPGTFKDLLLDMPSFWNPETFLGGGSYRAGAREFVDRIKTKAFEITNAIVRSLDRTTIARMSEQAVLKGVEIATAQARKEFTHMSDSILDITHIPSESTLTNIDSVDIHFGKPSGELFDNLEQAEYFAKFEYKLPDYTVQNQGEGAYISVLRDIDETHPDVRSLLIDTGNTSPQTRVNNFLGPIAGHMRSSGDLISKTDQAARKTLVHGIQEMFQSLREVTKPLVDLPKKSRPNFNRFLTDMRDYTKTQGGVVTRGRTYDTLQEFEQAWVNSFSELPTEAETLAYFSYKKLGEWDYFFRNLALYGAKSRKGIRNFSIKIPAWRAEGRAKMISDVGKDAKTVPSDFFEGKMVESVPLKDDEVGLLIWDPEHGRSEFRRVGELDKAAREEIEQLQTGNYQVIQIAAPYTRPLKEGTGTDDIVHYVLTPTATSKRLSLQQIPNRPGGHVAYDYNHYVKQPKTSWTGGRQNYLGDTTIRAANTSSDARVFAEKLDEARRLLKAKDPTFDAFVRSNLPQSPKEVKAMFTNGALDLDNPIVPVLKGQRSADLDRIKNHFNNGLFDVQNDRHNLISDINREFSGERDANLNALVNDGTEDNPLFRLDTPRLVDPLTTANRASANLARNAYLEDFRQFSAEHFVQEFGDKDVLGVTTETMRNNPVAFLLNPKWNEKTANRNVLNAAKNFQRAFKQLMSVKTPLMRHWDGVQLKLEDALFNNLQEKTAVKAKNAIAATMKDPVASARKLAFNLKIGLFNIHQLWKQAQTFTHLAAILPTHAAQSGVGAVITRMMMAGPQTEEHLAHMAKIASKFGWKKDDFLEAYREISRSGITRVEGEHSWSDDMFDPKIFTSTVGQFLDKGQFFFREGERFTRIAAFLGAYREWRTANVGKTLTRKDLYGIMRRQDTLTVNMTRASNASWQNIGNGLASVPTQFFTYQIRLMEQMLGKQLTKWEKARVFTTYSMMYGIPVGVGGTALGVWPWYEDVQQYLLENGIKVDNPAMEVLHKGLVETMLHLITGTETNYGEAYGPGGLSIFKDIITRDKPFLEIALGASGSVLNDIFSNATPVLADIGNAFRDGEGSIPILAEDFADLSRNISAVNNAAKMYYAYTTGRWLTKNGGFTGDINSLDATLAGIFGFQPQEFSNIGLMLDSMNSQKNAQDYAEKQMIKYLHRWADTQDEGLRLSYLKQVKAWRIAGDIPETQFADILKKAMTGNYESLMQSLQWNFFISNAPSSQAKARMDMYLNRNKDNGS